MIGICATDVWPEVIPPKCLLSLTFLLHTPATLAGERDVKPALHAGKVQNVRPVDYATYQLLPNRRTLRPGRHNLATGRAELWLVGECKDD
jgi:hypothetical protein